MVLNNACLLGRILLPRYFKDENYSASFLTFLNVSLLVLDHNKMGIAPFFPYCLISPFSSLLLSTFSNIHQVFTNGGRVGLGLDEDDRRTGAVWISSDAGQQGTKERCRDQS